jgi:TolB-like protein/tetratricopeptide (TPR) repeat protein
MFTHLFSELKRRKVFRVAGLYGVTSWLLVQVVVAIETPLALPDWFDTSIIVLLLIGFPIALILAWAFDLTPGGMVRTPDEETAAPAPRNSVALTVGLVVMALAAGYLIWSPESDYADIGLTTTAAAIEVDVSRPVPGFSGRAAIAVLPFVNMSNDPEQEYFSDGITEDIITGLQAYAGFPVIARTSTFTYKGKNQDLRTVATELGAGYILEGSVQKRGNIVRINAQLIDAQGVHLWARKFDRALDDIFAVQDEITQQIVAQIAPEMMASEVAKSARVRTADLEAWDYYLPAVADTTVFLGFSDLNGEVVTMERNERARANAEKAVELDPKFAAAYILLSHIDGEYLRTLRGEVSDEFAAAAHQRALGRASRSRNISPFDATACSCNAALLLIAGQVDAAIQIQEEALAANPASAMAHSMMAKLLHTVGKDEEALAEIEMAKRLSPRDMTLTRDLLFESEIYAGLGDLEKAAQVAHGATLLAPSNYEANVVRMVAFYALGRTDEARRTMDDMLAAVPNFAIEALWITPLPHVLVPALDASLGGDHSTLTWPEAVSLMMDDLAQGKT